MKSVPPTRQISPPATNPRPARWPGFQLLVWMALFALLAGMAPTRGAAGEPTLAAGKETPVSLFPDHPQMKVFLPSNYNKGKTWPVIFYYHGMGGVPDTLWVRELAGGRDFIVVAMPYVADEAPPQTRLKTEREALEQAWKWLAANASMDESRVFLAGMSKGGWTVAALWEQDPARIKGLILLLAGRQASPSPLTAEMRGKPVYIGAGEKEQNLVHAMRARQHYRQCGAAVCFEVFEGLGHQLPEKPDRLRYWLRVHGLARPTEADGPKGAGVALAAEIQAALAEPDVLRQYRKLLSLADDPRVPQCAPAVIAAARARFAQLQQRSPAKEEWQAEKRLGEVLAIENGLNSLGKMKTVVDGLQSIARDFPDTRCGGLAAMYGPYMEEAYAKSLEATQAARPDLIPPPAVKPAFPSTGPGRGDYPIPSREGNKIIFKR